MAILPMEREFRKTPVIISTIPMIRAIGASVDGWKTRRKELSPEAFRSRSRII